MDKKIGNNTSILHVGKLAYAQRGFASMQDCKCKSVSMPPKSFVEDHTRTSKTENINQCITSDKEDFYTQLMKNIQIYE